MITGLTLTPHHKQERTVSVLKFYSSSWKEFQWIFINNHEIEKKVSKPVIYFCQAIINCL